MSPYSRREFLKTGIAAGTIASVGTLPLHASKPAATDIVTLGNSGVQVTRLAFGTGSNNGHVQAALGQQQFSKLVAYAYERGIRFFETAESYMTPGMLGEALARYRAIPAETPFVGDQVDDLKAAFHVGCRRVLVRTGLGRKALEDGLPQYVSPVAVHDDLAAVVDAQLAGKP